MKPVLRAAVSTLFFLATLGAAFAQHVKTDFDHQANSLSTRPIRGRKSRIQILCGTPELRMRWMPN